MEIRQLTFLRFLAASGVVVYHAGRRTDSLAWGLPLWDQADTAVSFFFVLSGFILAYVYSTRGVRRAFVFYVARVARILPVYWIALLLIASYELYKSRLDLIELTLSIPLLQAWWPGYSQVLNTPGWSLSVEFFFYLCFPFLLRLMVPLSTVALIMIAISSTALNLGLLIAVSYWSEMGDHRLLQDFISYHPLTHLATFTAGIASGLLFKLHSERLKKLAVPLMLGSLILLFAMILIPNPVIKYHHNGLFVPMFVAFLWGLGAAPDLILSRIFRWAPLVLLGEASYSIYILQMPVWLLWVPLAHRFALSPNTLFWLFYAVLVLVSIICFKWIEAPLREQIKNSYAVWSRHHSPTAACEA